MGLLDDAIREHLELKRRHGADPGELAQLEREAFGQGRRAPEPLEVPAESAEPAAAEPPAPLEPVEPAEPVSAASAVEPELVEPELVDIDTEPRAQPVESEVLPEPEPVAEDLPWEEPATAPEEPSQETVAFDAAEVAEAHGRRPPAEPEVAPETATDEEAEDVLEETPDFLQETPEHDRLWFEQRPPRDFDFDG